MRQTNLLSEMYNKAKEPLNEQKIGSVNYDQGSGMAILAYEKGKDIDVDESSEDVYIDWFTKARDLSKALRKAADFLDKHSKNRFFRVDID
jgi:hypothetical protein